MVQTADILNLLQNTNNNILELVKESGQSKIKLSELAKSVENQKEDMKKIEAGQRRLEDLIGNRMTPDRCGMVHADLERRMADTRGNTDHCESSHESLKTEIFAELKEGAKGWGKRAIIVLKIIAWASLAFGGSAVGAQAIGLLKSAGQ